MAASVLPDVKAPHNLPRPVFQPVVYRPRIADDPAGIRIQVAMAPEAVSGPVAPHPLPTLKVRAATPQTDAPRLVDAALVSDRADDQARQPPPPDADYGDRGGYDR